MSNESNDRDELGVEAAVSGDERVACPDDVCTGALDHEGRCGTCERVFSQYARGAGEESRVAEERTEEERTEEERADEERSDEGDPQREVGAGMRDFVPSEPDDDERECCDDDLCTGALGRDGVCGTCGRSSIKPSSNASDA